MKNLPLTIIITLAAFTGGFGQSDPIDPKRGSAPGSSMSISDIENINLTNGNLMLNMPLVSLPKGRGGLSASFGMVYNSKIYKPVVEEIIVNNDPTDQNVLYNSDEGGWRPTNSLDYQFKFTNRWDGGASPISCTDAINLQKNAYVFRVQITMPDGNDKDFRPVGYQAYWGDGYDDGFFNFSPYGKVRTFTGGSNCGGYDTTVTTSPIAYYSADGSNIRMIVDPTNLSFTLYFPDGSYYQSSNSRLTDRYGNYIQKMTPFTYSGKTANGIEDSVGRKIFYTAGDDPGETFYYQEGVDGEPIKWIVKTKTLYVRKQYQSTANAGLRQRGASSAQMMNTTFEVVSEIVLPSQLGTNRKYTFGYNGSDTELNSSQYSNGFGELTSVGLPSGATATYEFGNTIHNTDRILAQGVTKKTLTYDNEYDGQTTSASDIWTYSYNFATYASTTVVSPDGSSMTQDHYSTKTQIPLNGHVRRIVNPTSKVEKIWATNASPWGGVNSFVKQEFTSIKDANGNYTLTAIKEFAQDKNGNPTSVKEYDYVPYANLPRDGSGYPTGLPSGVTAFRTTLTDYNNATPDSSDTTTNAAYAYWNHSAIKGVVASTEIKSSANQTVSKSEITYDNYSTTANPTLTRTWDSTKGSLTTPMTDSNSVKSQVTYSSYGFPLTTTDANGVVTTLTYGCIDGSSGSCPSTAPNDLYPTKTEVASNHTSLMRTSTAKYDYYTGVVTEAKDLDNDVATVTEYDDLGRPIKVRSANGTALESWTQTTYDDVNRRVIVKSDLETKGDYKKVAIQHFDQLGRVRLSRTLEDSSFEDPTNEQHGIKTQTRYRFHSGTPTSSNGEYTLTSNPYRAATSSAASSESTMGWTVTFENSSGNLKTVKSFAGSGLPSLWGTNTNSTGKAEENEDANATTTIDEAGKKRRSITDAFGRFIRVDEPDASGELGTMGSPSQDTSYSYDTLGNLTQIVQGGQTRTFTYNSQSRLTSSTNPESGTFTFSYDNNGNILTKTDARGISTTFTYDALNRATFRNYSDTTPDVTYTYDDNAVSFSKGRLTKVASSISESSITSYDAQERITGSRQSTNGQNYDFTYTYNLDDDLLTQTYPSGKVVEFNYDASGDLTRVGKTNGFSYANSFAYAPSGQTEKVRFGNGRWETAQFNSRRQITQIGLGYSATNTGLWKTNYEYGEWVSGSIDSQKNNGNLARQTITVPTIAATTGFTAIQSYTYDSIDRLKSATETISSSQTWKQTFNYDRFGNKSFDTGNTTLQSVDSSIAKVTNPEILTTNNRFKLDQDNDSVNDYGYDSSGNLTANARGQSFAYNAENLQITAIGTGLNMSYAYDGNNKRIKTYDAVNDRTTVFVYDAEGDLAAEYTINGAPPTTPTVSYLTEDALGSLRVISDSYGDVKARRDFLPYGEELYAGLAGRNANQKFSSNNDDARKKFATYQRDSETGLDFAQSRYYSAMHGRFTSPDEFKGGPDELFDFEDDASDNPTFYADLENPQSLNKYQYGYNNPNKFNDPTGHCPFCVIAAIVIIRAAPAIVAAIATASRAAPAISRAAPIIARASPVVARVAPTVVRAAPRVTRSARAVRKASSSVPKLAKKTYQTYTKPHLKTGKLYRGRTSGTGTPKQNLARRDSNHKKNDDGYGPAKLDKSSSDPDAIRGREQQLIDADKAAGRSGNKINGISPKNPKKSEYINAAEKEFGKPN